MGRALFSQNYTPAPTHDNTDRGVRTYETWSKSNPFDPDSDEFFIDAEYEAFMDPAEYQRQQEERQRAEEENRTSIVMQIDTDSGVSLSSGSPLLSSRGSPMAVGADDPAVILADAGYTSPSEWDRSRFEDWMRMGRIVMPSDNVSYMASRGLSSEDDGIERNRGGDNQEILTRVTRVRSPSVSSIQDRFADVSSRQDTTRRTITITPIDVTPIEYRTSSPPRSPSPATPETPLRIRDPSQMQTLFTPSPAPSVTPRIYNWQSTGSHWPWIAQSPTPRPSSPPVPTASSSPLTNPNARISRSRINLAPVRVRIPSAAV
ncbi:hypothetical protein AMATHDRAFT_48069 [Amanita thiersii Skay4041]|uniref:Uncharacterized protein n=1 Tax=Amanita thiersii Skay4041 TaxID=703135 RepID=A0A2A9NPS9_9AGAR|nr:hypothetical protein AMATHDRAFT_48069 [Amanita thiersii Skay4041]